MLISPDEVVTGVLVNAIAVVGRQISKAASGLRKPDEVLLTARWFETFRLTGAPPDLPGLSSASGERLAAVLGAAEIQAALQALLAARLTDAPEIDASRARDAVRLSLSDIGPDAIPFAGVLADYYDDQICSLVARLETEEPPVLAQIRSEAFSSRIIGVLQAIERHTAALADEEGGRGHGGLAAGALGAPLAGRLLAEVTDPFDLEVHRPVQVDDPLPGLPVLPKYVPREHDHKLAEVVRAAAEDGASGVAVLVGGSSTGKTRACWEALRLLRERLEMWRLWHPIDPSRPEAALRELPSIGPRTVIWLNEAQFYLDVVVGGLGERVAAGLRELLRDSARAPVLVLATVWPEFWHRLIAQPAAGPDDPHAHARELLAGRDITVPTAFTAAQLRGLGAAGDPRLVLAARAAEDGRIVQFLAGAPELLVRYRNAPPPAAALVNAAMDARRLGMGIPLPLAFLEAAAPGYLTDSDWDALPEDWLEQALAYTAAPCKGTRGPLARIRPRATGSAAPTPGPAYRLADFLEQHGRHTRRQHIPPASFWMATRFASSGDLPALARAAESRGLLRDAARLRKQATAQGDAREAATLVQNWHSLSPCTADPNPAQWAAAHVALDEPRYITRLLHALREAGAEQPAADLAARAAAHVALDHPDEVARLLHTLRAAGYEQPAADLAARSTVDKPAEAAKPPDSLREAGTEQQAADLAALDEPAVAADLLDALRKEGAEQQAAADLAARAAAQAVLDDPYGVARLLYALREAGAEQQAADLAARDPAAHAALDNPAAVADLLDALRVVGAEQQAADLAARAAAHAALGDPAAVADLLNAQRRAGAAQAAADLAARAAAHAALDNPAAVARLFDALREAGAEQQAADLAVRAAAHTALDNPYSVARLLNALRKAGAEQPAADLAARAAAHAALHKPYSVAVLLIALRKAGAEQSAADLAARAAAHAALDMSAAYAIPAVSAAYAIDTMFEHAILHKPADGVALLLGALRRAGAEQPARMLVDRLPVEGRFDLFREQPGHEMRYRFGRAPDGSPAPSWGWDDLD
jgi:hypothetical protein